MLLRHRADRRTVAYLAATVFLAALQWADPALIPVVYLPYLALGIAVAVISHNHNHVPIWRSRALNLATRYVISIFYGFPSIAWVPTHNRNHHKFNNRPGDASRSPALFRRNHLLALLVYPPATSISQQRTVLRFMVRLWRNNRRAFWAAASEFAVLVGFMAAVFAVDWRLALILHLVPQQVALYVIQMFNYVQHVEADADSRWNHSRNFTSPLLNGFLFNNGYHTVHHEQPGVHWSRTPALHAALARNIDPALNRPSLFGYLAEICRKPIRVGAVARPESRP